MSKSINYQTASLVLKSSTANITSNYNTNFTWTNISLKNLLGSGMYDKFNKFNITLVQIAHNVTDASLGATLDECGVSFKMSGLKFVNQTFSSTRNNNTSYAVAGLYVFPRNSSGVQSYYANNSLTFDKDENVSINIYYTRISDDTATNANAINFPAITFIFQIVGVPEQEYTAKNVMIPMNE
jgi:hypothetical protein